MAGHLAGQAVVSDRRWRRDEAVGNETIRVHPEQRWMELRLPTPMAGLSNTPGPACTYRLQCPVTFSYRRDEWAAQATNGSVRYDISSSRTETAGIWTRPGTQEGSGRHRWTNCVEAERSVWT